MSIPKYQGKQLTLQRLSDDVMKTALERAEFIHMDVDVARRACYMWLSHAAVWEEELSEFEKALHDEDVEFDNALCAVEYLSVFVEGVLSEAYAAEYRTQLDISRVKSAMRRAGLGNSISVTEAENMLTLLAIYAVGAENAEMYEILNTSRVAVLKVAEMYQA